MEPRVIKLEPDILNKEVPLGEFVVTADDIREFAEAVGDLNPLYLDVEAARQEGYPSVIAPPTFCMHLRGQRLLPEVEVEPGFTTLHAGQEFEYYDEIYAGRTYSAFGKLVEVYEKTGRSGPLGVIVREMVVKDATGKTVVVLRERQMVRSPERKI
jgi:acyl dehydratase